MGPRTVCWMVFGVLLGAGLASHAEDAGRFGAITIILPPSPDTAEAAVAAHLKHRIPQVSDVQIDIQNGPGENQAAGTLSLYLGVAQPSGPFHDLCAANEMTLPARGATVFPEGYAVKSVVTPESSSIVAVGADARGVLYAAGEVLRRLTYGPDHVIVAPFAASAAPGFRYRGFSANQGGTMRKVTGARAWTEEERQDVILEYALAGANTFYSDERGGPHHDFLKQFGFMTVTGARPNQLQGDFPPEWKAHGRESWEGPQWVCPSVTEARAALLAQWREDFAQRADHDVMRFYAGDPGGCTCERCAPFGKTFVELSAEMAKIWLELHPKSAVQIANQGLDNAGDQAILDYLNAQPRTWCSGLCYGPGSNAMSEYFRDIDMRDDLFTYPGMGPVNRYIAELHRQLPYDQRLIHYSDITHYISAQFAMENPEPNLVKSYGRRTFHARPVAMYRIFQQIMPFSEGDIIYSEGNHDEFHQYMWNRLLFGPNRTLNDVMMEYCTLYFGSEAAPTMVEALLQLEENMEAPLAGNDGIARYYTLVKEAGAHMPAWRMERDYRWRLHMQKAALDQYIQLKLRAELDKEARIRAVLEPALESGEHIAAAAQVVAIIDEPVESDAMRILREEAGRLGEETDQRHADRITGYFKLDQPLRPLPEMATLLKEAQTAETGAADKVRAALQLIDKPTQPGRIFW